ncbi:MAG: hypothetical protein ACE15D_17930 [Candidatus Eisenbacteria bacterium]|nr:hypothetical protein [Candidatus Eisenbacteria bacterium]
MKVRLRSRLPIPLLVLFAAVSLLLASNCGTEIGGKKDRSGREEAAKKSEATPAAEAPDPALLGFSYEDSTLGLRFSPPRGWPPLEPELLAQTRAALEQMIREDDRFVSRPVRFFYEKDKRLFMILSEFPDWPVVLDPHSSMADYKTRLLSTVQGIQVQESRRKQGKLDIYRFEISNPVMVDWRLMILRKDRPPVQVDYLVPKVVYPAVQAAMEASSRTFEPM